MNYLGHLSVDKKIYNKARNKSHKLIFFVKKRVLRKKILKNIAKPKDL